MQFLCDSHKGCSVNRGLIKLQWFMSKMTVDFFLVLHVFIPGHYLNVVIVVLYDLYWSLYAYCSLPW